MKLLITLDFPPAIGGIQKYLYGIVRFCYSKQDHVLVGGIQHHSHGYPGITANVRYYFSFLDTINRKLSLLLLTIPYLRLCKQYRGMLSVACGNIYAAFIPWLFSGIIRQPYSIYTYGTELVGLHTPSIKNSILKQILFKAEKLYTLGTYSEKILRTVSVTCPIETVPPRLIPDTSKVIKKARHTDACTVLSVGRLVKHKGHANLIRAAARLVPRKNYSFIIVGNGPEQTTLISLCTTLQVDDSVSIKQNLSDEELIKEFERADIFILPSREIPEGTEGFGIVLLEAMAHRVPIIASATGGIPEVLDHGTCGLLIEPDNVDALVDAIQQIAGNLPFTESLVNKAHERLQARYVW